jgi:hypothetical protein
MDDQNNSIRVPDGHHRDKRNVYKVSVTHTKCMGRKAMGSQIVRFTASQRRLILDYLEGGYIRNDATYAADWKIVVEKLNAQNKFGGQSK